MLANGSYPELYTKQASQQNGKIAMAVAVLLGAILCVTFYSFKSNSLIGDGLRHLLALRTILPGTPPTFQPKPWLEIYRNHYDDMVVHNHFLFGAVTRSAFALQQKLGIPGDALIAMQAVNAAAAAIAGALFFLLGLRLGASLPISLAVTLGLCLSPAYLLAATNIAEAALALPFFIGTLLLLTSQEFSGGIPLAAGVLAGFAALAYLLAGSLVPSIALAMIATRRPLRSALKPVLQFVLSFGVAFMGIWVTVLLASGYHSPDRLLHAILSFPQQGTYGGFKLSSLVATPVGLTQAFVRVLPDDFVGLRSLYQKTYWPAAYVAAATLIVCALLAAVFYVLLKRGMLRNPLFLSCLSAFLLVEAACAEWDAYYQKLQVFALILCWVMVILALSRRQAPDVRWPELLFLGLVAAGGAWMLKKNIEPSLVRANAQQLQATIGNGELITTWTDDVMHMILYSDREHLVSLPDLALARHLDSQQVETDLDSIIQQALAQGRSVYFYGLFDEKSGSPSDVYETRFRLSGITEYLQALQRKSKPVARLEQPGRRSMLLYQYVP